MLNYSEPTNHLDMESIDALAIAVNNYSGGLVLVSHDMRLISQVAKEIWICDNKTIEKYKGDIMNFKMDLRKAQGIEDGGSGKLKGDASVKAGAKKPKPKKKVVSKLSVAKPIKEEVSEPVKEDLPQSPSEPAAAPSPPTAVPESSTTQEEAAPVKKYVPIHLRRKMEAEAAAQANGGGN